MSEAATPGDGAPTLPPHGERERHVRLLADAAARQGSVRLTYGTTPRRVDVLRVGATHVRGFCHLRGRELSFRLDAVEAIAGSDPLF